MRDKDCKFSKLKDWAREESKVTVVTNGSRSDKDDPGLPVGGTNT